MARWPRPRRPAAAGPGEGLRYLNNARGILRQAPAEGDRYVDVKPVREAMGTAYLAVLEGINEGLLRRGVSRKELPRSVDAYRLALQQHFRAHNGTLLKEFEDLYYLLHLGGYYRSTLASRGVIRELLNDTQRFIERVV